MKESKHFSRTGAIVDLKSIHANMEAMKAAALKINPDIKVLATVKADAYGHGACEVANCVKDLADMYSVACTDEGIELRNAGSVEKPILILGPTFAEDDEDTIRFGLTQTVFTYARAKQLDENAARYREENGGDPETLRKKAAADQDTAGEIVALLKENDQKKKAALAMEQAARDAAGGKEVKASARAADYAFPDHKAHIHVAVDTGMSRIGLTPDKAGLETLKKIASLKNIVIDGIFTHFATADETDKTETMKALEKFRHFRSLTKESGIRIPLWHCANTASIMEGIGLEGFDMCRAGIGLYGMYPSDEVRKDTVFLKPALMWYAYITHVKEIEAGTSVSYGYRFTADRRMRIGTVCIGYADGYPRALSLKGTEVLVNGKRCPILGRICMDQMMIDLSSFEEGEINPGVPVILLGAMGNDAVTAEELAEKCGTINYEITCNISSRVPRKYLR